MFLLYIGGLYFRYQEGGIYHKVCMDRMADAGGNGCRVCSAESDPGNDEIIKDVFQVTIY